MGGTNINITVPDRPLSAISRDHDRGHDLHDEEPVTVHHPGSPTSSVRSATRATASHSGSSSHPDGHDKDYVNISISPPHLHYPDEEHDGDHIDRQDQISRVQSSDRGRTRRSSRSDRIHRTYSEQAPPREVPRSRPHQPHPGSPTESHDSAEDFIRERHKMANRPQSYYADNYPHSGSSGSGYAQQMVPVQPPPPHHYAQYAQMQGPPPVPYPAAYPHYTPHPASHVSSPYAPSPYGPQSMVPSQYGAPSYFPPQHQMPYGQPYPPPQQYPQQYMQYGHHMPMQMPPYVDQYRVQSPGHASPPPTDTQQELLKRIDALMKEKTEEKKDTDMISKDEALRQAMEQVKAEKAAAAAAAAARSAEESRLREEARQEAIKAVESERQRAADQADREAKIRKEAAEAAIKAADAAAAAKAERAELEKKIADTAAEKAKTAAEKEAAEAAAKKEAEAKKAQDEAEAKLKEAEEAIAKAKAEAEAAEKKAAENAPPEKKAPVRFRDAIGRNYNFPFDRCHKWREMEGLINQAFAHIDNLADWVHSGNYDLLGPDKEIIMPEYWRETIQPDMQITMMLWPMPEKDDKDDPLPPPIDGDAILSLDDILNPGGGDGGKKKGHGGGSKKKKSSKPSGLAAWMIGGAPGKRSLKK